MKQAVNGKCGFRSIFLWIIIGVLCALPSFCFAFMIGFTEPGQIAAMVAVVATYVCAFSRMEGWLYESDRSWLARSVRAAAWVKAGLGVFSVYRGVPDMWLGMLSVSAVQWAVNDPQLVNFLDTSPNTVSVGMTALITFVQGLNISILIYLIGGVILGFIASGRRDLSA